MKTLSKIADVLLVVTIALSVVCFTFIGAAADVVTSPPYGENGSTQTAVYSSSYNLKSLQMRFRYPDGTNRYDSSYYVTMTDPQIYGYYSENREPTFTTIPPPNGTTNPTFYSRMYNKYSDGRLFTHIYNTDETFTANYGVCTDVYLTFGEMVINPELSSGAVDFQNIFALPHPSTEFLAGINYSGSCYFPLVDGGFREVPFEIGTTWYTGIPNTDYLESNNFRFSLVPSEQRTNNTFAKYTALGFYELVYNDLSIEERQGLINPSTETFFKEGDPIAFKSLVVYGHWTMYPDGVIMGTNSYYPSSTFMQLETPASLKGVTRPTENFLEAWNSYDREVDFNQFDFVEWIEQIVIGLGTIEILPNFYLLYPIIGSVALALIMWVLKTFVGG